MVFKNNNYHKDTYKKIVIELVNERFDKIKELTDEINHDNLLYHFKGNTAGKRFDDFNNGMELFSKTAKKIKDVFKSDLNKIRKRTNKSEHKRTLENVKLLYES